MAKIRAAWETEETEKTEETEEAEEAEEEAVQHSLLEVRARSLFQRRRPSEHTSLASKFDKLLINEITQINHSKHNRQD